jgi:uncharacterized RDD family membrane protein YckC
MSRSRPTPAQLARREAARQRKFTLTPPEGVTVNFHVGTIGARFGAQMLDVLISVGAVIAIIILLALTPITMEPVIIVVFSLLLLAIRAPYYILSELFWNGRTLGKRIMGLRVISADGRGLSTHAVVLRNLMKEVEVFVPGTMILAAEDLGAFWQITLLIWIGVLLAVPFLNRHRQRIGDLLAHTVVVRDPRPLLLPDLAEHEVTDRFVFTDAHLGHYGRFELQTLEAFLRSHPLAGAPANLPESVIALAAQIRRKIGYDDPVPDTDALIFLHAFYRAQRAFLERRKLYGDVREDKHHREPAR